MSKISQAKPLDHQSASNTGHHVTLSTHVTGGTRIQPGDRPGEPRALLPAMLHL